MFVFALAAGIDERTSYRHDVERMLAAWNGVPCDGSELTQAPSAAAGILRWEVVDRDKGVAPIWDGNRQLLAAGDVRLYNRQELALALDLPQSATNTTDLELAWLAFLKWGYEAPRHLVGDFAFAVWDQKHRTLFATRDQLGVRPLYYHLTKDSTLLASDVHLLLPFLSRPIDAVNDYKVLEKFSRRPRRHGPTFFEGITSLRPGHYLTVVAGRVTGHRYWSPPIQAPSRRSYEDSCDEFRSIFRRATRDRLESDRPIVAHSSGGFDSSAILMVADELYRQDDTRPPLVMASALTPGMPCDDSRYMDAVARRTRFEGIRWSALDSDFSDIHDPRVQHPGTRRGMGGGPRRELSLAQDLGARVLLSGMGGDSVCFASGVLRDMFRSGRWRDVASETVGRRPLPTAIRQLVKAILGLAPPRTALTTLQRLAHRPAPPPRWMGPRLRALYPYPPEELDIPPATWPSHLTCELWARITSPQFAASVGRMAAYGHAEGVEVRMPFVDVRLVEHIFSVPWEDRIPRGDYRRLARDAVGHLLPEEFAHRADQGSWSGVFAQAARKMLPDVRALVTIGEWLSAPYIDHNEAKRLLSEAETESLLGKSEACVLVAEFGIFEAWLRRLLRYDAAQRGA